MTVTSEGTIIDPVNNVIKKRQQKTYHDVLGRPWKTELLDWEGGAPYSTVVNTYNTRNQITQVNQYQGSAISDGSCPSTILHFGTDSSWKQSLNPGSGWQDTSYNDSSWSAAVDEGAYGASPWGSTPSFPTGTPAHWIWYHDTHYSGDYSTVYFRKTFTATAGSAVLTIRADDGYTAYLNGQQVAYWFGWQGSQSVNLQLMPGATYVLAVQATNQGGPGGLVADVSGSGAVCEQTTMSYDGQGRLRTKHVPQQSSGTTSTYDYFADDTIQKITDARGATSNFTYNARHLATAITFTGGSSDVLATAQMTFGYDGAGNRSWMNDASGHVDYGYSPLSQLTSETRQFNGLPNSYPITYEYNLAGGLKTLGYPGSTVSYGFDAIGRTKTVTAAPYMGVSQYLSDVKYRAWDSPSVVSYGNDTRLELTYNARQQLLKYNMKSYLYQGQRYDTALVNHQYHPDGKLLYAGDSSDSRFNRANNFDSSGRLREAYSGYEADAFAHQTSSAQEAPYRQSYQYDALGNLSGRLNRFWSESDSFAVTYQNGRQQDSQWQHDAEGNIRFDKDFEFKYDALGRNISLRQLVGSQTTTQTPDADGQMVKRSTFYGGSPNNVYYLRSTVLGGKVLTEYNHNAGWVRDYVYVGNQLLATKDASTVNWRHVNPVTGSRGDSSIQGYYSAVSEPEPMGIDLGFADPAVVPPNPPAEPDIASLLNGMGFPSGRCRLEGMPFDCRRALQMLAGGQNVTRCLNDDCDAHLVTVTLIISGQPAVTSRFLATEGDPAWDGSLDGTYGLERPLSKTDFSDANKVAALVARIPEYLKTEMLVKVGGQGGAHSQDPVVVNGHIIDDPQTPCHIMADVAQSEADTALYLYPRDHRAALAQFDKTFSTLYVGGPFTSSYQAYRWRGGDGRTINSNYPFTGGDGFRNEYKDSGYNANPLIAGPKADQTHHFAAYFSMGINNQIAARRYGEHYEDNQGDLNLGTAAYDIGRRLRAEPSMLRNIGLYIRRKICIGPGHGLYKN